MSSKYDRAITVFSPDGHLFQVEYAQEAVKKGSTAVAVRGKDCVVLGVEKKAIAKLQDDRTVKKIALIDDHIAMAFSGLTADARVLISRARVECKSYKLTTEVPPSVEYLASFIANLKQKYTQSNGRRPFGLSCLIVGFDTDGTPHLYQTDPSGTHFEYYANSVGKSGKSVKEFLEKSYSSEAVANEHDAVKLAVKALLEGVQSSADHMDISLMRCAAEGGGARGGVVYRALKAAEIESYVQEIEKEREEEAERKRQKKETAASAN